MFYFCHHLQNRLLEKNAMILYNKYNQYYVVAEDVH